MCKCGCVEKNTITFRLIYSLFLKANHHLVQPSKHKVVTCVSPEVSMRGTCVCMAPEQSTVILLARHRHLQWCGHSSVPGTSVTRARATASSMASLLGHHITVTVTILSLAPCPPLAAVFSQLHSGSHTAAAGHQQPSGLKFSRRVFGDNAFIKP